MPAGILKRLWIMINHEANRPWPGLGSLRPGAHGQRARVDAEQVRQLRRQKALPILEHFEQWLKEQLMQVLPASAIGKAMAYSLKLWPRLTRYTEDGRLNIDNNPIENSIRPVALAEKLLVRRLS